MKKMFIATLVCFILLFTFEAKANPVNVNYGNYGIYVNNKNYIEEVIQPIIYDIPLNKEQQIYIWDKSQQYEISYELILSIMFVESSYRTNIKSITNDIGIMQLNENTIPWLVEQLEVDNFNPYDFYDNINAGVWYLDYIRSHWREQDYCEEDIYHLVLLSYNMGISGCYSYVDKYGLESEYTRRITEYKTKLEGGEINFTK